MNFKTNADLKKSANNNWRPTFDPTSWEPCNFVAVLLNMQKYHQLIKELIIERDYNTLLIYFCKM